MPRVAYYCATYIASFGTRLKGEGQNGMKKGKIPKNYPWKSSRVVRVWQIDLIDSAVFKLEEFLPWN